MAKVGDTTKLTTIMSKEWAMKSGPDLQTDWPTSISAYLKDATFASLMKQAYTPTPALVKTIKGDFLAKGGESKYKNALTETTYATNKRILVKENLKDVLALKDFTIPQSTYSLSEKWTRLFGHLDRNDHYTPLKYPQCAKDLQAAIISGTNDFDSWNTKWESTWASNTAEDNPKRAKRTHANLQSLKKIMYVDTELTDKLGWSKIDDKVKLKFFEAMIKLYDRVVWNQMFTYLSNEFKGKTAAEGTTWIEGQLKDLKGEEATKEFKEKLVVALAKEHKVTFVQEYLHTDNPKTELQGLLGDEYVVHVYESKEGEVNLIIVKKDEELFGAKAIGEYGLPYDGEGFFVEYPKVIFGTMHAGKSPKTCANYVKLAEQTGKMFIIGADCNENVFEGESNANLKPLIISPASDLPTVSKERSYCQYQWKKAGDLDQEAKDVILSNSGTRMADSAGSGVFYTIREGDDIKLKQITSKADVDSIRLPTDAFPFDHFMIRTVVKSKPLKVTTTPRLEAAIAGLQGVAGRAKRAQEEKEEKARVAEAQKAVKKKRVVEALKAGTQFASKKKAAEAAATKGIGFAQKRKEELAAKEAAATGQAAQSVDFDDRYYDEAEYENGDEGGDDDRLDRLIAAYKSDLNKIKRNR
eukprot:121474_1